MIKLGRSLGGFAKFSTIQIRPLPKDLGINVLGHIKTGTDVLLKKIANRPARFWAIYAAGNTAKCLFTGASLGIAYYNNVRPKPLLISS